MNPFLLIDKYYPIENRCKEILVVHSRLVRDKALQMVELHPNLMLDRDFILEAALLHDIGMFLTDAPRIDCHGTEPYIRHGILGAELMRKEGFPRHALVCERHTGAGISIEDIRNQKLPLPLKDFLPVSLEEQLICFADKFYSKTKLTEEKTVDQARTSLLKFSDEGLLRFDVWRRKFL